MAISSGVNIFENSNNVVYVSRCYSFVISDELGTVMSLEALNNALVFWLDMCSEVGFEVFNSDALEIGRNNVT